MLQTKAKELRNLTGDELTEKEQELRKELFNLRLQAKLGKLEKLASIRLTKRSIAQVKTVQKEKEDSG